MQTSENGKATKARPPKSTNAEIQARVTTVMEMMLAGAAFPEIRQYAAQTDTETNRPWGVEARQIREYMSRAWEVIQETVESNRTRLFALHLGQRRLLYNKTVEMGDYRTALQVLRDSAELQGIYPPKTLNVGNDGDKPFVVKVLRGIDTEEI